MASEAELLALSLTGERLAVADSTPPGLASGLERAGWDLERLRAFRRRRVKEHEPWPVPVPLDEVRPLGFARFQALQAEARKHLGLLGSTPEPAARPGALSADERRLMADRPPHWG